MQVLQSEVPVDAGGEAIVVGAEGTVVAGVVGAATEVGMLEETGGAATLVEGTTNNM